MDIYILLEFLFYKFYIFIKLLFKNMELGDNQDLALEFCYFLTRWSWRSYLKSLSFSFMICKMDIITSTS